MLQFTVRLLSCIAQNSINLVSGYGKRVPGFDPDPSKPPMIGNFYPSSGETFSVPNPDKNILNVGQNSKRRMEWKKSWRDVILPDLVRFHPDLIIISAGFDAHARDDINMGYISVMEYDYSWLTKELVKVANKCCSGKVVSVLEGKFLFSLSMHRTKTCFCRRISNSGPNCITFCSICL